MIPNIKATICVRLSALLFALIAVIVDLVFNVQNVIIFWLLGYLSGLTVLYTVFKRDDSNTIR